MIFLYFLSLASIIYESSSDKKTLLISGYEENVTKAGVAVNTSISLLEYVEVSGIITEIGPESFLEYYQLIGISFPIGLKYLRSKCFCKCYRLTTVSFQSGLLSIDSQSFTSCSSLKKIRLPSSLTFIDGSSFSWALSLTKFEFFGPPGVYSTDDEGSMILKGTQSVLGACGVTKFVFPSFVTVVNERFIAGSVCSIVDFNKTTNLSRIENEAFRNSQILSITFPQGIKHIGSNLFLLNKRIDYMFIPKTLQTYGSGIFGMVPKTLIIETGCECLKEENGIVYNGDFTEILIMPNNLTEFRINKNLSEISTTSLKNCGDLSNLTVEYGHDVYASYKSILYIKGFSTMTCCPGGVHDVTVIYNCTTLGNSCLSGLTINSITFERNSITKIQQAFTNSLLDFNFIIPEGVTTITMYCFTDASIPYLEFPESLVKISDSVASSLNTLCINMSKCRNLKVIPNDAFANCNNFKELILPPNLESIGERSFSYCSNLINLEIPHNVFSISDDSFISCVSLVSLTFNTNVLNSIGMRAFKGSRITDLEIPSSVKIIKQDAFAECHDLNHISFGKDSKLEELQNGAFRLTSIETIELGANLTILPSGALSQMNRLKTISINGLNPKYESKNGILYSKDIQTLVAFPGGLSEYSVDSFVIRFGDNAFFKCINLKRIKVDGSVVLKEIGSDTFLGCTNLTSIAVPSSVQSIESGAFKECTSLQTVSFVDGSLLTILQSGAFSGCESLTEIKFEGSSMLERISDSVFENAAQLETFDVPETLKFIGSRAFAGCSKLFSIYALNFSSIGQSAFSGCEALSSIKFGPSLSSIGQDAFRGCSSLRLISYCGTQSFADNAFNEIHKNAIAYVPIGYSGDTFGGLKVSKILDKDCQTPTFAFTSLDKRTDASTVICASLLKEE